MLGILSKWLVDSPGIELEGTQRLLLVPHGVLAYLPFAALKTPEGKYLVERYSLLHLPSASFILRRSTSESSDAASARLVALAPQPTDLPAAALEVHAIERAHQGTQVLLGKRARESALRDALSAGSIVHVAGHGVLNRANPLFSHIDLIPGQNRLPKDDGRLEVHEVLGLQIKSPLVFLSGCETGLGPGGSRRYAPGEDYATLAAAFLTAGARQVVATLWAVPDTGAAVFATRFYDQLSRTGPSQALAAAQRILLAEGRFRHPYYWAGYRVTGTESTVALAAVP